MGVEAKEVLDYLGIDLSEDATLDTFKSTFNTAFIKKDLAVNDEDVQKAIIGEQTRKFATELKRTAKESGIELGEEETKLPVGDLARLLVSKKDEQYTSKIADIEKKSAKPSEQVKEWEEKYNTLNNKFADVDKMREDLAKKYEAKEQEFVTFQKDFKLNETRKDIWGKANSFISDKASDLERTGFQSYINQNYTIELDGDKPVILKEGHRIPDPNKAGEFLDPLTAIKMEAANNKILKVTDPKKVTPQSTPTPSFTPDGVRDSKPRRVIRH